MELPVIETTAEAYKALVASAAGDLPEDDLWYVQKRAIALGVDPEVATALTSATRRVRTPEGAAFYKQPIGSVIIDKGVKARLDKGLKKSLKKSGVKSFKGTGKKSISERIMNDDRSAIEDLRKESPAAARNIEDLFRAVESGEITDDREFQRLVDLELGKSDLEQSMKQMPSGMRSFEGGVKKVEAGDRAELMKLSSKASDILNTFDVEVVFENPYAGQHMDDDIIQVDVSGQELRDALRGGRADEVSLALIELREALDRFISRADKGDYGDYTPLPWEELAGDLTSILEDEIDPWIKGPNALGGADRYDPADELRHDMHLAQVEGTIETLLEDMDLRNRKGPVERDVEEMYQNIRQLRRLEMTSQQIDDQVNSIIKRLENARGYLLHKDEAFDTAIELLRISEPLVSSAAVEEDPLTLLARSFSSEKREKLAEDDKALPDGSFPIENKEDLSNAIQAFGRAKSQKKAKKHIIARAKALGAEDMIPESWTS